MGTTMSEPCIYDKLSESIDILRQSGYRYGMSEREIERLIKQVLETNEPRREPPEFPILRATIKVGFSSQLALISSCCFFVLQLLHIMNGLFHFKKYIQSNQLPLLVTSPLLSYRSSRTLFKDCNAPLFI